MDATLSLARIILISLLLGMAVLLSGPAPQLEAELPLLQLPEVQIRVTAPAQRLRGNVAARPWRDFKSL